MKIHRGSKIAAHCMELRTVSALAVDYASLGPATYGKESDMTRLALVALTLAISATALPTSSTSADAGLQVRCRHDGFTHPVGQCPYKKVRAKSKKSSLEGGPQLLTR
jgi:hypothetical protein